MASSISGSDIAANSRQGVEINSYSQVQASALPRIFSNSEPVKVLDGRSISGNVFWDESVTTQVGSKKLEIAPNHQAEQRDLGYTKLHRDDTAFEDLAVLSPVEFVSEVDLQAQYPVVLDLASQVDPADMNGVIEPFPIRADAPQNRIEGKQTTRGPDGSITNYVSTDFKGEILLDQVVYYDGMAGNYEAFLEIGSYSGDEINIEPIPYETSDVPQVKPFTDSSDAELVAEYLTDDELAIVVGNATGSWSKFGKSYKSAPAGWTILDNQNGTDSIAFSDKLSVSGSLMFASGSLMPHRYIQEPLKITKQFNLGFADSFSDSKINPFDASRIIEGNQQFYPSVGSTNPTGSNLFIQDIPVNGYNSLLMRGQSEQSDFSTMVNRVTSDVVPFYDTLNKSNFSGLNGTGSAVVKISIDSEYNENHLQYAGRTDARLAATVSSFGTFPQLKRSLFLSSAIGQNNVPNGLFDSTGIAGTGFFYYSPTRKIWVEKRYDHSTSFFNNNRIKDYSDGFNALEINVFSGSALVGDDYVKVTTGSSLTDPTKFISKQTVTGTVNILKQFTASPQLGYFAPYRESLLKFGYDKIGSPTSAFGAPFAPKYHAFEEETIKLRNYIKGPFLLKKAILKLPVTLYRRHIESEATHGYSPGSEPEWVQDVVGRKDLDNYVFFLYRQRRRKKPQFANDSLTDITSSTRFLIASGSVCVYNSASFGGSFQSGFYDVFGQGTNISLDVRQNTTTSGSIVDVSNTLNSYALDFVSGTDPFTGQSLTLVTEPLHGPSLSFNADLQDLSPSTRREFNYTAVLEVEMNCGYTKGGFVNPTLMYLTTSTGNYSSSLAVWQANYTRTGIFNRYPYTGTFANPNPGRSWTGMNEDTAVPPITTLFGEFWYGGTATPAFSITGSEEYEYPNSFFYNRVNNSQYSMEEDVTPSYIDFNKGTFPNFDIEIGRTGLSFFSRKSKPLDGDIPIVIDGRGKFNQFVSNIDSMSPILQRTSLVDSMKNKTLLSVSPSTLKASGSSFIENLASLLSGYVVPTEGNAHVSSEYLLFPEDELVLGLDAGVTPPPDIAPAHDKFEADFRIGNDSMLFGELVRTSTDDVSATVPAVQPILKENIWHHAGASYLRILSGEAELILIGDYVQNESAAVITRTSILPGTTLIGDELITDEFDVAESDALNGTYRSDILTGTIGGIFERAVAFDGASRNNSSGSNVQRWYKVSSDHVVNSDIYFSGINESPNSAFKNSPNLPAQIVNPLAPILGGVSIASGSFFRGQPANKRKPSSFVSAYYNPKKYGQFRHLIEGIPYTQFYNLQQGGNKGKMKPPISITFESGSNSSQNLSKNSKIDGPFFDEE